MKKLVIICMHQTHATEVRIRSNRPPPRCSVGGNYAKISSLSPGSEAAPPTLHILRALMVGVRVRMCVCSRATSVAYQCQGSVPEQNVSQTCSKCCKLYLSVRQTFALSVLKSGPPREGKAERAGSGLQVFARMFACGVKNIKHRSRPRCVKIPNSALADVCHAE